MKYRFAFFLLCLVPLLVVAQTKVRVYGYVIDTNNRGIELANVYFQNTTTGTVTNNNGYYDISLDVKDSATIVFSSIGYQTIRHTIQASQKIIQISVVLPTATKEMKDVEVTASHRQNSTMDYINPVV